MWFSSLAGFVPRSGAYVSYGRAPVIASVHKGSSSSRYGPSTSSDYHSKHAPLPYKYSASRSSRHYSPRSSTSTSKPYYYGSTTSAYPSTYERVTDTTTTVVHDTYGVYVPSHYDSRSSRSASPSSSLSSTSTLGKHVRFNEYDDQEGCASSSRYADLDPHYSKAASAFHSERHSRSPRSSWYRSHVSSSDRDLYNDHYYYDHKHYNDDAYTDGTRVYGNHSSYRKPDLYDDYLDDYKGRSSSTWHSRSNTRIDEDMLRRSRDQQTGDLSQSYRGWIREDEYV